MAVRGKGADSVPRRDGQRSGRPTFKAATEVGPYTRVVRVGPAKKTEGAGDNPLTPAPVFSVSGLSAGFTLPKTLLGQDGIY
jgi:hypothetical protein